MAEKLYCGESCNESKNPTNVGAAIPPILPNAIVLPKAVDRI